MRCSIILIVSFLLTLALAGSVTLYDGPSLLAARNAGKVLVKFYAPWCGHCQNMAAAYEAAAEELSGKVAIGEVNCDVEKKLCSEYNIRGFPTIILFEKANAETFTNERTAANIVQFALHTTVSTPFELREAKDEAPTVPVIPKDSKRVKILNSQTFDRKVVKGVWLVEFILGSGFDNDMIPIFNQLAENLHHAGVSVGKVNALHDVAASDKLGLTSFPAFVLIVNGTAHIYDGERTYDALNEFVNKTCADYFAAKAKQKEEKRTAKAAAKAAKVAEKEKARAAKAEAKAAKEEQKRQKEEAEKAKNEADGEKEEKASKKKGECKKHGKKLKEISNKAAQDAAHGHDSASDDDDDDGLVESPAKPVDDDEHREDEDDDDDAPRHKKKKTKSDSAVIPVQPPSAEVVPPPLGAPEEAKKEVL